MRLKTKKIIAKEFIILIIAIAIGLLSFVGTYIYNYLTINKENNLQKTIENKSLLADSLHKSYSSKDEKQKWFYNALNDKIDISGSEYNTYDKLWKLFQNILAKDSIKIRYDKIWTSKQREIFASTGFETSEKLESFLKNNRFTQTDLDDNQKSLQIFSEVKSLKTKKDQVKNSVLNSNAQIKFSFRVLMIALIVLFGFRYIFYAIKWSVSTLKQKGDA